MLECASRQQTRFSARKGAASASARRQQPHRWQVAGTRVKRPSSHSHTEGASHELCADEHGVGVNARPRRCSPPTSCSCVTPSTSNREMSAEQTRHPFVPDNDDAGGLDFAALGRAAGEAMKKGERTFPMPKGFTPLKQDPNATVGTLAQLTNELHIACFKGDLAKAKTILAGGGETSNKYRANAKDCDSPPLAPQRSVRHARLRRMTQTSRSSYRPSSTQVPR